MQSESYTCIKLFIAACSAAPSAGGSTVYSAASFHSGHCQFCSALRLESFQFRLPETQFTWPAISPFLFSPKPLSAFFGIVIAKSIAPSLISPLHEITCGDSPAGMRSRLFSNIGFPSVTVKAPSFAATFSS